MTEDDKKRVTEWLGECWHDPFWQCNEPCTIHRTFKAWDDFGACFDKLVEKGEYYKFEHSITDKWVDALSNQDVGFMTITEWLLSRTDSGHMRLCALVAAALKEGVIK
ncbi:MAG: hypothetical protein WC637_00190 [Victivallales bacterium]|jgi:hypothetical protein